MSQEQRFVDLPPGDVPGEAARLKGEGYRMVQICGVTKQGETELIYSFDRGGDLVNYRVGVPFGTPVGSITPSYWAAFVYENEVHDLFGVEITGMRLDYKGNFFKTSVETPWKGPEAGGGERWAREPPSRSAPSTRRSPSPYTWTWSWRTRRSSARCPP